MQKTSSSPVTGPPLRYPDVKSNSAIGTEYPIMHGSRLGVGLLPLYIHNKFVVDLGGDTNLILINIKDMYYEMKIIHSYK